MGDNFVVVPLGRSLLDDYTERIFMRALMCCFAVTIGIILLAYLAANGIVIYLGICGKNSRFYGVVNCTV